jgi:Holliday junction DNA helicase RuvA
MISYLSGTIKEIHEKSITLVVNNIGLNIFTPQPTQFKEGESYEFYIYFHWNYENGPSLYGFSTEQDRIVFLTIIECPKIGPSIALNILSQMSSESFIDAIKTNNERALSSISGIGEKKAEQIIVQLKHKVTKLLETKRIIISEQKNSSNLQNLSDVLFSLNYSKQEISQAIGYISEKFTSQSPSLDQMIRASLAFLTQKK